MKVLVKMIAYGFTKYIRDPWCLLDVTVVSVAIAPLVLGEG